MNQYLTARQAMLNLASHALGGSKIPHSVSNPVFRKISEGKYALSSFVFTFTREMLANKKAKAPVEWILIDPVDGTLIERISCAEKSFFDSDETEIDLRPENDKRFSKDYSKATLMLLDLMLKNYAETGVPDSGLNDAYMYMMLQPVSLGLKDYYRALNNL